ncbi:MAG: hypothetical protein IJX77_05730 [Ruminococcus sp.]|nr:hypothetical protein [Ruminococcus sp.]
MKFKQKGRKIYRTKEKNYYGKSPVGKFLSGALTVLLIGGIGFLGYSVAEPIINYTKKAGDEKTAETTTLNAAGTAVSATETMTQPVTEPVSAEKLAAAVLEPEDFADLETLRAALLNIPTNEGIEYAVAPLKVSGGELYYASGVYEAQSCGAVRTELTLSEITSEITAAGFKPAAEISLLRDNILPQTYPDSGYTTAADGSLWLDEINGKPWVSPFSDSTNVYLGAVADEIMTAGFEKIICSDVVFPPFSDNDYGILAENVSGAEGSNTLTNLANQMYSKITNGGASMMLEVSVIDLLQGNDAVIQPMLLDVSTIVLEIDFEEIGTMVEAGNTIYEFTGTPSENAEKAIGLVQHKLADYNVAVEFSGADTSELLEAKDVISDFGYTSFIIG